MAISESRLYSALNPGTEEIRTERQVRFDENDFPNLGEQKAEEQMTCLATENDSDSPEPGRSE